MSMIKDPIYIFGSEPNKNESNHNLPAITTLIAIALGVGLYMMLKKSDAGYSSESLDASSEVAGSDEAANSKEVTVEEALRENLGEPEKKKKGRRKRN